MTRSFRAVAPSPWNETTEAELRKLSADGFSATEIFKAINAKYRTSLTRNAVIGKRLRMGLCGTREEAAEKQRKGHAKARSLVERIKPPKAPKPPKAVKNEAAIIDRVRRLKVVEVKPVEKVDPDKISRHPRTILDPLFGGCRWPVGMKEGETLFCTNDRGDLRPYCAGHKPFAYQASRTRDQIENDKRIFALKRAAHAERQIYKRVNFNE